MQTQKKPTRRCVLSMASRTLRLSEEGTGTTGTLRTERLVPTRGSSPDWTVNATAGTRLCHRVWGEPGRTASLTPTPYQCCPKSLEGNLRPARVAEMGHPTP